MVSTSFFAFLLAALQFSSVDLTMVTVPTNSSVDVPLLPVGEVEVRREETISRLKVKVERVNALLASDPIMRAYVAWAVSPEGEFENLGELEVDGRRAEVETATSLQRFGIIVTAEPHFMVDAPNTTVAFRSGPPRDDDVRIEPFTAEVGRYDYSAVSLPPQGSVPARVTQARMAFEVAEQTGAAELADPDFRRARVALDSMEELLRRIVPMDILLPYVNDSIRLSEHATRVARAQPIRNDLAEATRRAALLQRQNEQMQQEIERLDQRQNDVDQRIAELRLDLQDVLNENRALELEKEEADRQVRTLEAEVARLLDPWPPLRDALMFGSGARQTARGLLVTLPASYFGRNNETLEPEGREMLARLAGVLAVDEVPEIRIEGHTSDTGPASRNLTLSEERAEAVRVYLVEAGVPEESLDAEGFGTSRPIASNDDNETRALNERVEIIIREIE